MLRLGDRVKFSEIALEYKWNSSIRGRKEPHSEVVGIVSKIDTTTSEHPIYDVIWEDGNQYGVSNRWAEEWLRRINSDEIGTAIEKWEEYFGEINEE